MDEKLTLGGRFNFVGRRPVEGISGNQSGWVTLTKCEPYTVVDIFASYKFSEICRQS